MDQYRLLKACLLRGFSNALLIASETYAYTLFLSVYPQKTIPYLYGLLAFFAFIGMQFSQPFLKKDLRRFMQWSSFIFAVLLIGFVFVIKQNVSWLPFVFAIFVITAVTITNTTNWIAVTALFNLREFKAAHKWLSSSSTIGSIVSGLSIPFLLKYYPPIFMLYIIIILFVLILAVSFVLHFLREKPEPRGRHVLPFSLNRDALFVSAFIALVMMIILFIFADFSLKSELALNFTKQEIGQFLAPFFAITSVLTILIQFFVLPGVLRRFGVVGLIMACPIIYIVVGGILFVYPSFWTATLLAATAMILRYSFFMMGNQMLLNVYPPAIRNRAKYQVESYGRSLGMALGALILISFAVVEDLRLLSLAVILTASFLTVVAWRLRKNYFATLKNAINLHRFDTDYLSTERVDQQLSFRVASQALNDSQEDILLFGLSLFKRMKVKKIPPSVIAALSSQFDTVKKSAIRVLEASGDEKVVPHLMKQLAIETNPKIVWHLVNGVLHFSADFLISYAMTAISSDDPPIKAAAIAVYLQTGDKARVQMAEEALSMMLNHPEARSRFWAANVLKTGALNNAADAILKLLHDSDESVVRNVLFAATLYPDELIISTLLEKLSKKNLSYSVGKTLVRMGARVIQPLLQYVQQLQNVGAMRIGMILFSKFQSAEAETALVELLLSARGELLDKCVISLAYRAKQFELSSKTKRIILKQIQHEVDLVRKLETYYREYEDADLRFEIRSRIFYARKRYLYLLASFTEPKTILQIIPSILLNHHHSRAYASATELLELCVRQQALKDSISVVLESQQAELLSDHSAAMDDDWLMQVLNFKRGLKESPHQDELIERVLVLRKVSLFSFLSAEMLKNIAHIMHVKKIPIGKVIFKEGEQGDGLYIVIRGSVTILKNEANLKIINAGGFFGELALLDHAPRFAAALAREETELFFIEKNNFNRLTDEVPEILKAVTTTIITYLRDQEGP